MRKKLGACANASYVHRNENILWRFREEIKIKWNCSGVETCAFSAEIKYWIGRVIRVSFDRTLERANAVSVTYVFFTEVSYWKCTFVNVMFLFIKNPVLALDFFHEKKIKRNPKILFQFMCIEIIQRAAVTFLFPEFIYEKNIPLKLHNGDMVFIF